MGRKKIEQDYHDLASKHNYQWLGGELPKNANTPTLWRCPNGHLWEGRFSVLQRKGGGNGCRKCSFIKTAQKQRLKPEAYHALAAERGFLWVGDPVPNTSTKTMWRCSQNHEWPANYLHIQRGRGCPHCSDKIPRTLADYIALAESRDDLIWLGPMVARANIPTGWKCKECGYEWKAHYSNIKQGQGCRKCADKKKADNQRYGPSHYLALAESRGFKWVGDTIIDCRTNTLWQCDVGHIWGDSWDDIKAGSRCPECYKEVRGDIHRYGPDQYKELAKNRQIEWLGPEVRRTDQKTLWRCENGHRFRSTYDDLKQGKGCSHCNQSRGERRIKEILNRYGIQFEYQQRFTECRFKRELPFDFYFMINSTRILLEFDGQFHTESGRFSGGKQKLIQTQRNDAIKTQFAQDYGFVLIRIPYTRFKEIESILRNETLECAGVDIWSIEPVAQKDVVRTGSIDGTQLALF